MGKKINYKVIRRNIKHPRLELKTGDLIVVAPRDESFDISRFVESHSSWIEKKLGLIKEIKLKFNNLKLEEKSIEELKEIVNSEIFKFSDTLNINPNRVVFREMKTKWGSCSSKNNLTFNTLLRFLPKNLIKYVTYHEICHLRRLKHDVYFWNYIEKEYSNHKKYEEKLFGYWFLINNKIK
ncbi:MAG: M48 family metallopeptidase [Candidatus Paceibacterota bacterium]